MSDPAFYPDNGLFDTFELRHKATNSWQSYEKIIRDETIKDIREYKFFYGFDLLECYTHVTNENMRFAATMDWSGSDVKVRATTWNVNKLDRARVCWVKRRRDCKDICGDEVTFNNRIHGEATIHVRFDKPFDGIPFLVIWLKYVDVNGTTENAFKIAAYAKNVTKEGCDICCATWKDGGIYKAIVSWMAVKPEKRNIVCGSFETEIELGAPKKYSSRYVEFQKGRFKSAPTVTTGFNLLEQPHERGVKIRSRVENVTKDGFQWSLDTGSELTHNAAFIAISNDDD